MELTQKNFTLFAAKHYHRLNCIDEDEFFEDLKRFKYIKRLLNRYHSMGHLSERLILNHLIVLLNVFGNEPTIEMLAQKIQLDHWPALKPFLVYLRALKNEEFTGIKMDKFVIERLREIARL